MMKQRNETIKETPALRRLGPVALAARSANKITVGALGLLLGGGIAAVAAGTDNRAPEVPDDIAVPAGNKVHFQGYAQGVQIYTWDGSSWGASVPEAVKYIWRSLPGAIRARRSASSTTGSVG